MICPRCEKAMKEIPAGVSKRTGRPYKAFFKCETCNITANADGGPRKEPKLDYQGSNNEIMNALREVYKREESIERIVKQILIHITTASTPDMVSDITADDIAAF